MPPAPSVRGIRVVHVLERHGFKVATASRSPAMAQSAALTPVADAALVEERGQHQAQAYTEANRAQGGRFPSRPGGQIGFRPGRPPGRTTARA
ncbi:hypothetical protein FAGKG844_400003 [Frankia sp. AgKG'84/4]